MRLEEAAAILGVPINSDLDSLKQTYRKLALAWHPDKCNDPKAKEKFQQISIAYTKLISSRSSNGNDIDSDDEGQVYGDEVNEMRAFVRMFMDLVGIFNDDHDFPDEGKLSGGVSFGMMFGNSDVHEEWSTDEDEEVDLGVEEEDGDGDEDEEEYDTDDNCDENELTWEPQAKNYIYMNLKEEVSKAREYLSREKSLKLELDDSEMKRKQKNAKKRSEKRRKQKEKKLREAALKAEEEERIRLAEELHRKEQEELARKKKEELRLAQLAEDSKRKRLFELVSEGQSNEVISLFEQASTSGVKVNERIGSNGRTGAGLMHYCVSVFYSSENRLVDTLEVQQGKLSIAKYLLSLRSPTIDLSLLDEHGRTVLHIAALFGDSTLIELLLEQKSEQEKKNQNIDINAKCLSQGWTPLHYAASNGAIPTVQLLIKIGALLNVHAYIYLGGKDSDLKGPTPLELAKKKLEEIKKNPQSNSNNNHNNNNSNKVRNLEEVISELSAAVNRLEMIRQQREAEKSSKESKLKAEKQRLALKEQAERELLEKKQKQLKEKQEKERLKIEEEAKNIANLSPNDNLSKKKKKKKEKEKDKDKKVDDDNSVNEKSVETSTNNLKTPSLQPSTQPQLIQEIQKPNTKSSSYNNTPIIISTPSMPVVIAPVIPNSAPSATVHGDVKSRDDLISHLLNMGFPESECLAAISSCGLNVDDAISWLCDRPNGVLNHAQAKSKSTTSESKEIKKVVSGKPPQPPPSNTQEIDAQLKYQKDKEHKEEQRRINRAWNARVPQQRAEEERKKAEAERTQQELERQRILQQQQQQQQLQQQQQQQQLQQQQQQQQQQQIHLQQQYPMHGIYNPNMYNVPQLSGSGVNTSMNIAQGVGNPSDINGMYLQHSSSTNSIPMMNSGMNIMHGMYPDIYGTNGNQNSLVFPNRSNQPFSTSQQIDSTLQYQSHNLNIPNLQQSSTPNYDYGIGTSSILPSVSQISSRSRVINTGLESTVIENTSYGTIGNVLHPHSHSHQSSLLVPPIYDPRTGQILSNTLLPQQNNSLSYQIPHLGGVNSNDYNYIPSYEVDPTSASSHNNMNMNMSINNNNSNNSISINNNNMILPNELIDDSTPYVDGAVHLSAVAKPFIPKYVTSPSPVAPNLQIPSLDRVDSSGLPLNVASTFSLPPLSLPIQRTPELTPWSPSTNQESQGWNPSHHPPELSLGGFVSNEPTDSTIDNLMSGTLDLLSLNGIVDHMSISSLDSELTADIGESLFSRLTGVSSSSSSSLDRRRNRGLLFQSTTSGLNYDLSEDSKLSEDDVLSPFNQFITDVIDSPDIHTVYNRGHIFSDNNTS